MHMHLAFTPSYVTFVPPSRNGDFTLVIETLTHDHSICIRPPLPPYNVEPQNVTFKLAGGLNPTGTPLKVNKLPLFHIPYLYIGCRVNIIIFSCHVEYRFGEQYSRKARMMVCCSYSNLMCILPAAANSR